MDPLGGGFLLPLAAPLGPEGEGGRFDAPSLGPGCGALFAAPSQKADRGPCSASAVSAAGSASAAQPLDSLPTLTNRAALARRVQWTKQPGRSWRSAPVFASAVPGAPQKSAKRKRTVTWTYRPALAGWLLGKVGSCTSQRAEDSFCKRETPYKKSPGHWVHPEDKIYSIPVRSQSML